jgi:hypothetical protein
MVPIMGFGPVLCRFMGGDEAPAASLKPRPTRNPVY